MDGASHGEDWVEVTMEEFEQLLSMVDQKRCAWCNGLGYYLKRGHHPTASNMHTEWHNEDHFATFYDTGDGKIFVRPDMLKKEEFPMKIGAKCPLMLEVGESSPVYLGRDRDNVIGKAEIVEREGGKECLITLDMTTLGARKVLGLMNKGDDISMSGHFGGDHE